MLAALAQSIAPDPGNWILHLAGLMHPQDVIIGVLIPDYLPTIMAACALRRPRYLLRGLGFPLMRIVDAALCLRVLPKACRARSSGVWVSPTRRVNIDDRQHAATCRSAGKVGLHPESHQLNQRRRARSGAAPGLRTIPFVRDAVSSYD